MLELEHYRILREIHSLDNKLIILEKEIQSENDRVRKLEILENEKLNRFNKLPNDILELKNKIEKLETLLGKLSIEYDKILTNLKIVKTKQQLECLEQEKLKAESIVSLNEDQLLQSYEILDNLENENVVLLNFFEEFKNTKDEISNEVNLNVGNIQTKMQQNQSRIEGLWKQIPPEFKLYYSRIINKYPIRIAEIENNSCSCCRMGVNLLTISNLDRLVQVERCPGCQRIFLPHQLSSC